MTTFRHFFHTKCSVKIEHTQMPTSSTAKGWEADSEKWQYLTELWCQTNEPDRITHHIQRVQYDHGDKTFAKGTGFCCFRGGGKDSKLFPFSDNEARQKSIQSMSYNNLRKSKGY